MSKYSLKCVSVFEALSCLVRIKNLPTDDRDVFFFFSRMMKINHKNIQCRPSSVYIWRTEELLPHAAGGVAVVA